MPWLYCPPCALVAVIVNVCALCCQLHEWRCCFFPLGYHEPHPYEEHQHLQRLCLQHHAFQSLVPLQLTRLQGCGCCGPKVEINGFPFVALCAYFFTSVKPHVIRRAWKDTVRGLNFFVECGPRSLLQMSMQTVTCIKESQWQKKLQIKLWEILKSTFHSHQFLPSLLP